MKTFFKSLDRDTGTQRLRYSTYVCLVHKPLSQGTRGFFIWATTLIAIASNRSSRVKRSFVSKCQRSRTLPPYRHCQRSPQHDIDLRRSRGADLQFPQIVLFKPTDGNFLSIPFGIEFVSQIGVTSRVSNTRPTNGPLLINSPQDLYPSMSASFVLDLDPRA
jgi:hypothetical protein